MRWKLSRYIRNRILKKNKNMILFIVGSTGSGKSYSAMKLAKNIDHSFHVGRVCFTAEEFMKLLKEGNLKKGSVVIWDELGVDYDARKFMSIQNRVIGYILQTFRHRNLCVIMTLPVLKMSDLTGRRLGHGIVETIRIDYDKEQVICKYKHIEVNALTGKTYHKFPVATENGKTRKVKRVRISMPDKGLIEEYEKIKTEFTRQLAEDIEAKMKSRQAKEEAKKRTTEEMALEVLKRKDDFLKTYNKRTFFDISKIENEFEIGGRNAKKVKKMAEEYLKITENTHDTH